MSGAPMDTLKFCACVILTVFVISNTCFSQAQLLKDINSGEEPYFSEIAEFANVGTSTYFISVNELWKTDGTAANTIRMKAFKSISNLTTVGTTLYFVADNGASGSELWKCTGSAAGTVLVKDIRAGSAASAPTDFINVNGTLYFAANNGTHGKEVWKSNGTSAGTVLVKDIFVGAGSSGANRLTNVNGVVYFQANNNVHGYELWKTNGTSAGTVLVKDIKTGTKVGSFPELLTNVNGTLYFVAADNTSGRELWKSNGTSAGTVRVKDIVAGSGSPIIDNTTNVNGVLYFTANNGVSGKELWKSNGTSSGTVMVKDIRPGSQGADGYLSMRDFKVLNGRLYFVASDEEYGTMGLFTTDGTAAGTRRLTYLSFFEESQFNIQLTYYKGALYFFNGTYIDDETPAVMLNKMNPDGTGQTYVKQVYVEYYAQTFPARMIAGSTYLLFSARMSWTSGYELSRSDGTAAGTVPVRDTFVSTYGSEPIAFVTVGNVTYFTARNENYNGLYRTDGTPTGTVLLANYYQVRDLTRAGGRLFFFAMQTVGGDEALYKIENATSSPQLLKGGMEFAYRLTEVGNIVYFAQSGFEPSYDNFWRSDGTVAGTIILRQFNSVTQIFNYNGTAMLGVLNNAGLELWKSNGTTATTTKVTDLTSSTFRHYEMRPYGIAGGVYFFGLENGTHGYEMWRTNGTAAGTFMIQDLRTGDTSFPIDFDIADAAAFQNTLYFSAKDNAGVWALFKTGTTAGSIVKIKDLNGRGVLLEPLPDKLMIFTESADAKSYLWASDGTAAGTTNLKALGTRIEYIDPAIVNNVMYFNVSNNTYDSEWSIVPTSNEALWRSDGTACGTFVFNIGAYRPHPMEVLGTKLIFNGYNIATGSEPYAYNTTSAPASPCGTPDASTAAMASDEATLISEEEVLVFAPNPFSHELRFTVNGLENQKAHVAIYTIAGVAVETLEEIDVNREYQVGQQWQPGVYILKVNVGNRIVSEKVIKR